MDSMTFLDRTAARYAKSPIKNMEAYEHTMARTRSYLREGDHVLEIGAGTSSTAILLAPLVKRYTASDISVEMVGIGREKVWNAGLKNLDVVQAEADAETIGTPPYDAVLAYNLLHLLEDMNAGATQAYAQLKPGGYFISKTVCLRGKWYLRPVIWAMQAVGKAPFVAFLSGTDVEHVIAAAGFELVETDTHPAGGISRFVVARKPDR